MLDIRKEYMPSRSGLVWIFEDITFKLRPEALKRS